jgi:membrane protein
MKKTLYRYYLDQKRAFHHKILLKAFKTMKSEHAMVWAERLSFKSLWSLAPFIILLFAVAGSLGFLDLLPSLIEELRSELNIALPSQMVHDLLTRASSIKFGSLGFMGAFFLIVTFVNLMNAVDLSINRMWGLEEKRKLIKRLALFIPFIILLTVFLSIVAKILSFSKQLLNAWMLDSLKSYQEFFQTGLVATIIFLLFYVFLFLAYWILPQPSTAVKARHALSAAGVASLLVLLSFKVGASFQELLFERYSMFYGSLALIPLLLLQTLIVWVIVLYGAAICRNLGILPKRKNRRR